PERDAELPLRFPIQDVYRFDDRRILGGRVEAGTIRVGDAIVFLPGGESSRVKSIERWSAPARDLAHAGESVGITLEDQIFVERGHVAAHVKNAPPVTNRFRANVFWLGRDPLVTQKTYKLKLATQELECRIANIDKVIDASSLKDEGVDQSFVGRND